MDNRVCACLLDLYWLPQMESHIKEKLIEGRSVVVGGITLDSPAVFDAAETGELIVMDEGAVQEVECSLYVFDADHSCTVSETLPAAPAACAIHPDGPFAIAATLKPDNRIYAYDVHPGNRLWSRRNHEGRPAQSDRPQITDLSITEDGVITIFAGGIADYQLTADGQMDDAFREEREQFALLDEQDERGISFVKEYLESEELQHNLKALVELEIRLEEAFVRNHLTSLVQWISNAIERHDVHRIDLTNPDVPEARQKFMSLGKRLLYEAGRDDASVLDPVLPMIETHLDHQPTQAIQSDLQQLKQIVPEWVEEKAGSGEVGTGSCDVAPQGTDRDEPSGPRTMQRADEEGCGCLTLLFLSFSTGLVLALFVI